MFRYISRLRCSLLAAATSLTIIQASAYFSYADANGYLFSVNHSAQTYAFEGDMSNAADITLPTSFTANVNSGMQTVGWEVISDTWTQSGGVYSSTPLNSENRRCSLICRFRSNGLITFDINLKCNNNYVILLIGYIDNEDEIYYALGNSHNAYTILCNATPGDSTESKYSVALLPPDSNEHCVRFDFYLSNTWSELDDYGFARVSLAPQETVSGSVTSLSTDAFRGNETINSVNVPEGYTRVSDEAFKGCSALTAVNMPQSLSYLGGYVFHDCISLRAVDIPSGITKLPYGLFLGCKAIERVSIPEGVKEIPFGIFLTCPSLKQVNIPESVTEISSHAFKECRSLESITIPSKVNLVGANAFFRCSSLKKVTYSAADCNEFGRELFPAFDACNSLEKLHITEEVKAIPAHTFACCKGLREIIVDAPTPPSGLESVFSDVDKSNCRLVVPPGSEDLYRNSECWKEFNNIDSVDNVIVDPVDRILHVHDLHGRLILTTENPDDLRALPSGIYIINNRIQAL